MKNDEWQITNDKSSDTHTKLVSAELVMQKRLSTDVKSVVEGVSADGVSPA